MKRHIKTITRNIGQAAYSSTSDLATAIVSTILAPLSLLSFIVNVADGSPWYLSTIWLITFWLTATVAARNYIDAHRKETGRTHIVHRFHTQQLLESLRDIENNTANKENWNRTTNNYYRND